MNSDRIKTLEQWIKEDPTEPFNKYGLAMELLQTDAPRVSLLFDELLRHHTSYLPTYYIAANFYADQGNPDKAIKILEVGIVLAKEQDNQKAFRELKSLLDEMRF
jgi:tetratricopeptide (TPR) repeat protein